MTTDISVFPESEASTGAPCSTDDQASSSALATWKGYVMFIGLAIVAYGVARGSLAVRHRIYQDKVRPQKERQIVYTSLTTLKQN